MIAKKNTKLLTQGVSNLAKQLIEFSNGHTTTSSQLVAKHFKKEHFNVLQSIEKLECSDGFKSANFFKSEYLDAKNETRPEYQMTKNGFAFLVMGFTGKDAAKFKEDYIAAFDFMEKALLLHEQKRIVNAEMEEIRQLMHTIKSQNDLDAPNPRWQPTTWHMHHIKNLVNRNREDFGKYANTAMQHSLLTNPIAVMEAAGWSYNKITNFLYGTGRFSLDDLLLFCEVCGLDLLFMNKFGEILWPDNYPVPQMSKPSKSS